ncbi:MAG: hypothetical protein IJS39_08025 [Synergistaceae bacterium]|nr:hypothetical protein [Synergistaceae bacterium]
MIINHNLMSLSAVNASKVTHDMLQKSVQPLATGLRINSAADDASGIAISEKIRSQTAGYSMAVKNAQDGISLLRVAESALGDTTAILQRMRELSIQAGNDVLTSQDRNHINEEVQALKGKLDMVAESTQFNTKKLLDGTSGLIWSSDTLSLKAAPRAGASLSQKPEGSYRLEIRADPGKAQIQKSNILNAGTLTKIQQETDTEDDDSEVFQVFSEQANTLRDISQFHTSGDTFVVSEPQTLTVIQGSGKTADITVYGNDTLYDLAGKINAAISETLGQSAYVDNSGKFSTLTDTAITPDDDADTYTVKASLVIQSAVPGKTGEIFLAGSDEIIRALGMNTVQKSSESTYYVSVYDAHSGEALASDVKITGNVLHDAVGENIDVEFDPMAGTSAKWDGKSEQYILTGDEAYSAVLNLKSAGIIFQIGTNQAENFSVQFGDVSAEALGVGRINVMTPELAERSIGILDRAIDDIVKQRTQISAYSDSLEHSAANLAQSGSNLTDAGSRITDADTAKSTLRFIEFQILSRGQDMIINAANQQPEAVYSLLNKE